jgi:uncharacterized membrane protein YbhN (UPF0104 family)
MPNTETNTNSHPHKTPNGKWVWIKRLLTIGFFILVAALLFTALKKIEWQEVKSALQAYQLKTLLLAGAVAAISLLVFSSYDLLARHFAQHDLPAHQVLPLAFVCCVFTLNLAWIGGMASRFRLYSRLGLDAVTVTKIISANVITNWLGYIILAGTIFSVGLLDLPDNWKIGATALQIIGVVLLLIAASYFLACRFSKRREFHIFKQTFTLPTFKFALVQACLAALNWSLMGLIVYILLLGKIPYPTVLGILLISSIAGVITHIPAGIGVIETVFITMLQHQLAKGTILAALIGYRAVYFLLPLAIATIIYIILELSAKKLNHKPIASANET